MQWVGVIADGTVVDLPSLTLDPVCETQNTF